MPLDRNKLYSYRVGEFATKTMYHVANPDIDILLCGQGKIISPDLEITHANHVWHYISGPIPCVAENQSGPVFRRNFMVRQFQESTELSLLDGWSHPDQAGGEWNGIWSIGKRSRLTIALGPGQNPRSVTLLGHYLKGNYRTRISINGQDFGWQKLNLAPRLLLKETRSPMLSIEMEHEAPRSPGDQDSRQLAFFLQSISLR